MADGAPVEVTVRDVIDTDVEVFFEDQQDPEAAQRRHDDRQEEGQLSGPGEHAGSHLSTTYRITTVPTRKPRAYCRT